MPLPDVSAGPTRHRAVTGPLRAPVRIHRVTEPSCLAAATESYDAVADDDAALVGASDELDPLSRSVPAAFAELVRVSGDGVPGRARGFRVRCRCVPEDGRTRPKC